MRKVAVTGPIASGKTTVCSLFKEYGAYVVSADLVVHQLLVPSTSVGQAVIVLLGPDIVTEGVISRSEVAKRIFCDPPLLRQVENLLHPEVQKQLEATYKNVSLLPFSLFVAEVPLLFESGGDHFFDTVVLVDAAREERQRRIREKESYDLAEWELREQRLLPLEEKRLRADFVIENSGSRNQLRYEVEKIFNIVKG